MPRYLDYLTSRLTAAGGAIEISRIRDLGEAVEQASVVVNCTGIGARELVPDDTLRARARRTTNRGESRPGRVPGMMSTVSVRAAQGSDAGVIASIYNEGIAEREATFETEPRQAGDFLARIGSESYPLLVAEVDGQLVGWAGLAPYSERVAYAGIAECSIYVARNARGQGVGSELCQQLAEESERRGFYKLLGKVFPENLACVRMVGRCGFHEVGLHRCHGRLDDRWRDVLLLERLLGDAHQAAIVEE
jgi:L-amino acid N-acyltransferase YncA